MSEEFVLKAFDDKNLQHKLLATFDEAQTAAFAHHGYYQRHANSQDDDGGEHLGSVVRMHPELFPAQLQENQTDKKHKALSQSWEVSNSSSIYELPGFNLLGVPKPAAPAKTEEKKTKQRNGGESGDDESESKSVGGGGRKGDMQLDDVSVDEEVEEGQRRAEIS